MAQGPVLFKDVRLGLTCSFEAQSINLFAIEMVRIPEGPFSLGDPTGEGLDACFYDVRKSRARSKDVTYTVTSETTAINLGEELGFDAYNQYSGTDVDISELVSVPTEFPKGFNAFYIMKYQVSQGEYAAFVNELGGASRTLRYPFAENTYRFAIRRDAMNLRIATRPHRPCNWLSWADGLMFSDWAGLRPMTEFEYEKACRGFRTPENGEFAWGTADAEQAKLILGDEQQANEVVSGNCNFGNGSLHGGDGGQGPVREDAFASSDFLRRSLHHGAFAASDVEPDPWLATGASYWGVYGLSGNLWEFCVTVASPNGLKFDGRSGSGGWLVGLMIAGDKADDLVSRWTPVGLDAKGVGFRGGSWFTPQERLCIADRRYAGGIPGFVGRTHDTGFRAVLSDPEYSLRKEPAQEVSAKRTLRKRRTKKKAPTS